MGRLSGHGVFYLLNGSGGGAPIGNRIIGHGRFVHGIISEKSPVWRPEQSFFDSEFISVNGLSVGHERISHGPFLPRFGFDVNDFIFHVGDGSVGSGFEVFRIGGSGGDQQNVVVDSSELVTLKAFGKFEGVCYNALNNCWAS